LIYYKCEIQEISITVISAVNYNELNLRNPEAFALGATVHDKIIYPLHKEPYAQYVVCDPVVELRESSVVTRKGEEIDFDVCVIATGTRYPYWLSKDEETIEARKKFIAEMNGKILAARTIVVGGGGPVGVEFAGDVKANYPEKRSSSIII